MPARADTVVQFHPGDYPEGLCRVGRRCRECQSSAGTKAELVLAAIKACQGEFRLMDLQRDCPGVGRDWIRTILANLKKSGDVACSGRGPAARWRLLRNKGSNA